jgi:HEPN domain-containing protein
MAPHDRLDLARVLLARAVDDETLVRKVCSDAAVADSIVGFHAQQATEKLIKAVLAARGVTFAKSHALSYLIGLVEENHIEAPDELSEADVLSPWAVESHNSERGLKARSRPQTSRQTLTNDRRPRISQSRAERVSNNVRIPGENGAERFELSVRQSGAQRFSRPLIFGSSKPKIAGARPYARQAGGNAT